MARTFTSNATDRVEIASDSTLDATTAISVLFWVYWDNAETNNMKHLISKWNCYLSRISLFSGVEGHNFGVWVGGAFKQVRAGTPVAGRWYHYAGTYDGTNIKLRVFDTVTGVATTYTQAQTGNIDTDTETLFIGNYKGLTTTWDLEGKMSDVKIWKNIALTEDQTDVERRIRGPVFNVDSCVVDMRLGVASTEPNLMNAALNGAVTGTTIATINPPGIFSRAPQRILLSAAPSLVELIVAGALHSQTAAAPVLTQANALAVAGALHSQTADGVALTQANTLSVAAALLSQTADAVELTQALNLVVAAALLSQTADAPALTQANALAVTDALLSQTADGVALTQANTLSVAAALLSQTADNVALTQQIALAVADALMSMTAANPELDSSSFLIMADALMSMTAAAVALTEAGTLVVADATLSQTADAVVLTQANTLSVAAALLSQTADGVALTQAFNLAVNDALMSMTGEAILLSTADVLELADALLSQTADAVVLTQANTLSVAEALLSQAADGVALTQNNALLIDDALFTLLADLIALGDTPIAPDAVLILEAGDRRMVVWPGAARRVR